MYSINCKGKILSLSEPLVMGIINATPDSFYEGHLNLSEEAIVSLAGKMISDGADILDIGGQSTRPGSVSISAGEEMDRVLPVIAAVHKAYPPTIISVDTYHSEVARSAVAAGASMVNDTNGGGFKSAVYLYAYAGNPGHHAKGTKIYQCCERGLGSFYQQT